MSDKPDVNKGEYPGKGYILVSRNEGEPLPVLLEDGKAIVGDSTANSGVAQAEVVAVPDPSTGDEGDVVAVSAEGAYELVPSVSGGGLTPETCNVTTDGYELVGSDDHVSIGGSGADAQWNLPNRHWNAAGAQIETPPSWLEIDIDDNLVVTEPGVYAYTVVAPLGLASITAESTVLALTGLGNFPTVATSVLPVDGAVVAEDSINVLVYVAANGYPVAPNVQFYNPHATGDLGTGTVAPTMRITKLG